MQFYRLRRAILTALLFSAVSTFAPTATRAETLTLSCFGNVVYVLDLSARTAAFIVDSSRVNLTNVAISDSAISFVSDIPGVSRRKFTIDRTTGSIAAENYWYPQSGIKGTPRDSGQCNKIANKAF
jgi:hypothetical protein